MVFFYKYIVRRSLNKKKTYNVNKDDIKYKTQKNFNDASNSERNFVY